MTIRSIAELLALADTVFPDNNTELITPASLRNYVKDAVETLAPAYGVMQAAVVVELACTPTPQVFKPYSAGPVATPGFFTLDLANGTMTRLLAGAPRGATMFVVQGDISASGGIDLKVQLYKNGVATPFFQTVSASSLTNNEPFSFAAVDVATADSVYDLRVSTGANNNVTFNQVTLQAFTLPMRTFA